MGRSWAGEKVGSRERALAVPGWGREKGVGRSWVHLAAGNSGKHLSGLPDWVLAAIRVSSRGQARRGSVGFNSKAAKGGWVTWGLAPPSTAGQVLVPTGGRVGGSFFVKTLSYSVV